MPLLRCTLNAGDWLYIPAGYWHRTQAGAESVSLSVGLRMTPALDAFDALRPRLLESLRWRQRLPPAGAVSTLSEGERVRLHQELFTELGKDLAASWPARNSPAHSSPEAHSDPVESEGQLCPLRKWHDPCRKILRSSGICETTDGSRVMARSKRNKRSEEGKPLEIPMTDSRLDGGRRRRNRRVRRHPRGRHSGRRHGVGRAGG